MAMTALGDAWTNSLRFAGDFQVLANGTLVVVDQSDSGYLTLIHIFAADGEPLNVEQLEAPQFELPPDFYFGNYLGGRFTSLAEGGFLGRFVSHMGNVYTQRFAADGVPLAPLTPVDPPDPPPPPLDEFQQGPDGSLYDQYYGSGPLLVQRYAVTSGAELVLTGDSAGQTLAGGALDDWIDAEGGDDTLNGGGGADTLHGGAGRDLVNGEAGADRLYGGFGNDTLDGGADDDKLGGGRGDDAVAGGAGIDTVDFSAAMDPVSVDLRRSDAQHTGEGADTFSGVENLIGSAYADRFVGPYLDNRFDGGGGADELRGGSGNDVLNGDAGADIIVGDFGKDTIDGGAGDDRLYGGSSNDRLYGGAGSDILAGGPGADRVDGGDGQDRLYGDTTADSFVFASAAGTGDRVYNFLTGAHELEFDISVFGGTTGAFAFVANTNPSSTSAQQTFLYDTDGGFLYFDRDGAGAGGAAPVYLLTLYAAPALAAGDIALV